MNPTEAIWYVVLNGEQIGPISASDIKSYFAGLQLNGESYVWRDGFPDWAQLGSVAELVDFVHQPEEQAESTAFYDYGSVSEASYGYEPSEQTAAVASSTSGDHNASSNEDLFSDVANLRPSSDAQSRNAANDLVGARSDNSVLFSLSNLQAVSARVTKGNSSSPVTEGSGLIDVKALATSGPAQSRRRSFEQESYEQSMIPVAAMLPLGTRKSNTGLIIGLAVGGGILIIVIIVVLVVFLTKKPAQPIVMPMPVAQNDINDLGVVPQKQQVVAQDTKAAEAPKAEEKIADAPKPDEKAPETDDDKKDEETDAHKAEDTHKADENTPQAEKAPENAEKDSKKADRDRKSDRDKKTDKDKKDDVKKDDVKKDNVKKDNVKKDNVKKDNVKKEEPKAEPKPAPAPAKATNALSKDEVQSVIRANFGQVRTCSRTSTQKGTMKVSFVIKGNGRVSNARVVSPEFAGSATASCILKVVNGMKFRDFGGSDVPINNYPFTIQ